MSLERVTQSNGPNDLLQSKSLVQVKMNYPRMYLVVHCRHDCALNTCIQNNFLANPGRSGIFCLRNPGGRGV